MRGAAVVLAVSWVCGLVACSASRGAGPGPDAAAGSGGAAGAGGTGGAGSAGSAAGVGGMDASAGGAGSMPDAGGADAAVEAAGDAGPDAREAGPDAALAACAPPALICEDFEKYAAGTADLSPDWITYAVSGAVKVDATKPRGGKQSLHLTTQAGMRHYADLIRETRDVELLPRRHFGRMMVWLTSIPPQSHWNLNMSSGPMVGAPNELAKFFEGGMFGKLMSNYAQRGRVLVNGVNQLRGGGPEPGDPGADADCAVAAPAQKVAAGKWFCWEWEFDGSADAATAHLWVDGQAMTEIDAVGSGKQCQGPGFMGRPMMPNYRWESPRVFDKLLIGYEQYQDTPAQELWIDDLVISSEKVGCP